MINYVRVFLSWLILSGYLCRPALAQNNISTVKCIDTERKALLQFKDGLIDDICNTVTSWGDDNDCCQWRGVHCSNYTGHVLMIRVQGTYCLTGNLSSSIGKLKYLTHLNLSFVFISQPNLDFLGSLPNLEYLTLTQFFSSSSLYSTDPKQNASYSPRANSLQWLSNLSLLRYLDLRGVDLSEAKNWTNIVSQLPFLRVLHLDECQLPQNIPSTFTHINSSPNLRVLTLSSNQFNNTSIFHWLLNSKRITTQLVYLDLSSNSIQGSIPNGFGNLHHLSHLDFSNNKLEGPIPMEFRDMQSLSYLSLYQNHLQGSVFEIFTSLCNLQQLYLGSNNFTDELTNVIRALHSCENSALQILDLSRNRFWGVIPDTIDSFSMLRELYLDDNQLSGQIPQAIGQLSMLGKLDISSNLLEATLTHTHFLNLSRLRELYLSDNPRLVINVDASWDPPFNLEIISLRSCKLGSHFPNWLPTQTNLSYLDVSVSEISDSMPVSFWKSFSHLVHLNMSYNQFSGFIPNLPKSIFHIANVDLSSNLFEGAIPSGFSKTGILNLNNNRFSDSSSFFCPKTTTFLSQLDLSNNLLSGELPDCFMSFIQLNILHLENNSFSGSIPKSIGALKTLEHLHMQNNSFSGSIPASLENCTTLTILNLGYNKFIGNIPPWFSNIQSLGALILRRNNFVGEIPASICQLSNLQILDFAKNNLSGIIPRCISNFTGMTNEVSNRISVEVWGTIYGREGSYEKEESSTVAWKRKDQKFKDTLVFVKYIDFSFNEMSGEIPDELFNLIGLVSLGLSNNNLSGSISPKLGRLTHLELLDLSNNNLTGEIPESLGNLNSLAILDLSNNNLSGKIPLGTQLQGFNASSYSGNNGLCGDPLPKCVGDQSPGNALNGANTNVPNEAEDYAMFPGLYIAVVLGFIIGFWGVFGSLVIKTSWRHAWFRFLDNIQDRFYIITMGITAKLRR